MFVVPLQSLFHTFEHFLQAINPCPYPLECLTFVRFFIIFIFKTNFSSHFFCILYMNKKNTRLFEIFHYVYLSKYKKG